MLSDLIANHSANCRASSATDTAAPVMAQIPAPIAVFLFSVDKVPYVLKQNVNTEKL
jgi:hypothetical protein